MCRQTIGLEAKHNNGTEDDNQVIRQDQAWYFHTTRDTTQYHTSGSRLGARVSVPNFVPKRLCQSGKGKV